MRRLGVALLVYNYDAQGGMERQAARLAEGLAARGARVTVLTTFVPRGLDLGPRHELRRGVEVVRLPLPWWVFEGASRLFEARAALELARRARRVDAIYAVHVKGGAHAAQIARVVARPVLVKLACAGEHGDFASLAREPDAARLRELVREASRVLCLSRELEGEARSFGLEPARFARVTNAVDRARFKPDGPRAELEALVPGAGGDARLVLFVGRLDRQKRIDVLLRAFAELASRVPGARLALAGDGPLEPELRALARELSLEGKIAFLGRRDDVPELLRAAHVFALPSESEGLSNALLEALATGVPVVASRIPANEELVGDEREGLLVPAGDAPALARALERLLSDSALAAGLSQRGRELVAREHDPSRVVERHRALFTEAARGRGRERARAGELARLWLEAIAASARALGRHALGRLRGTSEKR
jgi:glycosyltransferase involved in cell wall biosynthesis